MKKIIRISAGALITAVVAALVLYMILPLESYVISTMEKATDNAVSAGSVKIRWNMVSADDVIIKTRDGSEFFRASRMRVGLSFISLLKRNVDIKYIEADNMQLNLKRSRDGKWVWPEFKSSGSSSPSFSIRGLDVSNSTINIDDRLKGARLVLSNVQIDIHRTNPVFSPSKIKYSASAAINPSGSVNIAGQGDVAGNAYNGTFVMKDVDINLIKPYMQGRSKVKKGLLSMESDVAFENGHVKAPSKIKLRNFDLEKGDVLMGVAGPLIVEMLKKDGEINISFSVWGRWNSLQNDLSEAFHKKILEETGRTITSPVESVIKGIERLLPF